MTVIIDTYPVPETGQFDLAIERSVDIVVSAAKARRLVQRWAMENVTYMLQAKTPTLTVSERVVWRVPVNFTAPHVGQVGKVGEVDVDVQTGELLNLSAEQMLQCTIELANKLPPYKPRTLRTKFIPEGIPPAPLLDISTEIDD